MGKNDDIMKLPVVSPRTPKRAGQPITQSVNHGRDAVSITDITPELAAQVVKHFVLPMFDTEAKKGLRRKYGRMQAA